MKPNIYLLLTFLFLSTRITIAQSNRNYDYKGKKTLLYLDKQLNTEPGFSLKSSSETPPAPCATDPGFSQQWGLYNNTNPDIDINACKAWRITEGRGVEVAVLNHGIELTHDDLEDNLSPKSYDVRNQTSPSIEYTGAHGTSLGTREAGIIAAVKDNSIGIVGVAPQSTLISISNPIDDRHYPYPDHPHHRVNEFSDGLNWAWRNGADIIDARFGTNLSSSNLEGAIENALAKGRGGKGTIVVFGTLTTGRTHGITYPANSNSDILVVGAINSDGILDERFNAGQELDVVAPGAGNLTTAAGNSTIILDTPLSGAFASGVAALVLSVNPSLSGHQVRDIIEQTAQKIRTDQYTYRTHSGRPNGTWNNEMGYGLVDAGAAVKLARESKLELWLKANSGGASWMDESGNGVTVTPIGMIGRDSELNFNPMNHFSLPEYYDTDLDISGGDKPFLSVTTVYTPSSDPAGALWGEGNGENTDGRADRVMLDYKASSGRWNNTVGAGGEFIFNIDNLFIEDKPTLTTVIFDEDKADGSFVYVNGKLERTFTSNHAPGTSNPFEIGRGGRQRQQPSAFSGDIAEVMVHSRSLNREEIESYLAIKYGITLDQSTPESYVDFEGTEIYDADGDFDSFDHDIIGIGQDDRSYLDQRISKSVNAGSVLILSNDADFFSSNTDGGRMSLGNENFLITGHNGGDVSFSEEFNNGPKGRMSRVWAFDKTGTVGKVYAAIKKSDVKINGKLYAVLSDDQAFDNSDRVLEMTGNGTHWFAPINPDDGDFMSFVSIYSPGGVSNSIIAWLKSDSGTNTTTDGEEVTSWRNSVLNPVYDLEHNRSVRVEVFRNAFSSLPSGPPTYETDNGNTLNFTPTVLFMTKESATQERLFTRDVNNSALEAQSIRGSTLYAVGRPVGEVSGFWSGVGNNNTPVYDHSILLSSNNIIYFQQVIISDSDSRSYSSISTSLPWSDNEVALVKVSVEDNDDAMLTYSKNGGVGSQITASVRNGYYHVLGNSGSLGFNNSMLLAPFGNVSETIIYDSPSLSEKDDQKIKSYLALKYGITLDQTTPQSYVNSSGTEIYDADGLFDDFDNNIIGIGQDDQSSLDQRISKSNQAKSFLTLAHDKDFTSLNMSDRRTSLGDGNFLLMGNNGGSPFAFERSFNGEGNTLMNRVWRIDKTGEFEDAYVSFEKSLDSPAPFSRKLYAILSTDHIFDDSDRVIRMTFQHSIWSAKINPRDGDFMTFVSTDSDIVYDLYIKDSDDDNGIEPNETTEKFWRSPDIWVRNNPDGIEQHQNPEYNPNNPNYVYVKVRNRGAISSTGNDQVKLYWNKASTVFLWPSSWDGTNTGEDGILMSGLVGTVTIPALDPGEETNLFIPWNIPNPRDYIGINSRPWHFCFLARIVSYGDPITNEGETYTSVNARANNNIAWKNVTVVDAVPDSKKRKNTRGFNNTRSFGGVISVGNPFDEAKSFSLELVKEDLETGKAIFDEAEVSLTMDKTLYDVWKRSGKQSELLESTYNEKIKRVQGNHAGLDNLRFEPNEMGILDLRFNFLPQELTDKSEFIYHVVQKDAETSEVVGGETYVINKDSRPFFESSFNGYGREETKKGVNSTSKASLDKIIPNPVSNKVRITYNLDGAKSAYLMAVGFYHISTKTTTNYDLDTNSEETTLDLKHYSNGYYQIALICDGKIVDVKTFIKQ